jgi:hypothetical protein
LTTDGHAQHPTIEPGFVAWSDNARGAFDVYVRDLDGDRAAVNVSAAGKRVSAGNPLDTRSAVYPASVFPSLAVGDGRAVVAWADNRRDIDPGWSGSTNAEGKEGTEPDDWEIFAASRAANGSWGAPVDVSNDARRADRHPSIAFNGNGQVLVAAWDSKELKESGVNTDVRYAQSPDATHWSAARQVGFDPNAMSERPQVAAVGPGARIVWHDSRASDWRWSIWTASIMPTGPTPPVRLTGAGNALYPSVDGSFVAFTSDRHAARLQRDATEGVFVLRG